MSDEGRNGGRGSEQETEEKVEVGFYFHSKWHITTKYCFMIVPKQTHP